MMDFKSEKRSNGFWIQKKKGLSLKKAIENSQKFHLPKPNDYFMNIHLEGV